MQYIRLLFYYFTLDIVAIYDNIQSIFLFAYFFQIYKYRLTI